MKIGNLTDAAAPLASAPAAEPARAGRAAPAAPAAGAPDESAKVALSSTAESLRTGSAGTDFDADKVARVAQAIAAGTFKVNPEAIADKLIANAQEVLGRVQRG